MDLISQPKSISTTFLYSIIFILLPFSIQFEFRNQNLSAYEVLQEYDFPIGLLPKGVTSYKLNKSTGEFSAHLNGTCAFALENSYQLQYKTSIEGLISKDRIKNLKGVSVKVLVVWLNIVEVVRDGGELSFSVWISSANFPVENFEQCPQCGCGLDCNGEDRFVSSS